MSKPLLYDLTDKLLCHLRVQQGISRHLFMESQMVPQELLRYTRNDMGRLLGDKIVKEKMPVEITDDFREGLVCVRGEIFVFSPADLQYISGRVEEELTSERTAGYCDGRADSLKQIASLKADKADLLTSITEMSNCNITVSQENEKLQRRIKELEANNEGQRQAIVRLQARCSRKEGHLAAIAEIAQKY